MEPKSSTVSKKDEKEKLAKKDMIQIIISGLALLISIISIGISISIYVIDETYELLVSESVDSSEYIYYKNDDSQKYISIPITFYLTNASKKTFPLKSVDIRIGEKYSKSWKRIYNYNNDFVIFPQNILPSYTTLYKVSIHIPVGDATAREIEDIYGLSGDLSDGMPIDTFDSFKNIMENVHYSDNYTALDMMTTEVTVIFVPAINEISQVERIITIP